MPKHSWQTTLADAMLRDRVRLAPVEHAPPPLCFAYAVWRERGRRGELGDEMNSVFVDLGDGAGDRISKWRNGDIVCKGF